MVSPSSAQVLSDARHSPGVADPLLTVTDLVVEYPGKGLRAKPFRALHGVSIHIDGNETLGLVGESGSGKTTLGRAILGLAPVSDGSVQFRGREIGHATRKQRRALSRDLQVVFQDPYSSLNPSMTVSDILSEPLTVQGTSTKDARQRIREVLEAVELPRNAASRLPREFSGGQRQRIAIARALALSPRLIVCDEAVSALDLSTQAVVLDLLLQIQRDTGVAYLFISHDLDVIRHISHRIAVMHSGTIVEHGDAGQVAEHPSDPYTQRLLLASPVPDPDRQKERRAMRARLASQSAERI